MHDRSLNDCPQITVTHASLRLKKDLQNEGFFKESGGPSRLLDSGEEDGVDADHR
jgi:hypothetical protein